MELLTIDTLKSKAKTFGESETLHHKRSLYGVTDGKAVGTYLEHKFQRYLHEKYEYVEGSSAKGIDFPELSGHEGYEHQAAAIVMPVQNGTANSVRSWLLPARVRV
jgi:hypothetical protein